jgi:cellulose synthase/poly-beta-1,6-N-acetylglucosamine synthase-like glycosyltransferase
LLLQSWPFIAQANPQASGFLPGIQLVQSNDPFVLPKEARINLEKNEAPTQKKPVTALQTGAFTLLYYLLVAMALSGVIPIIAFFIEHNLAGLHALSNHFKKCKDYCPRMAIVIPAWNEGLVLEHTIDILLKIDYPLEKLRLYIVDDGSTDNTQEILADMQGKYPDNVFHVRKESGGKGKAHAVNYGLGVILSTDWAEAILLIDADISFKKDALRRMARHLVDPQVGAVTGYIKVGNRSTNYITRSIGYEYIVSQYIARRAQNVLGVVACLAGGAQLHTRANIERLGGFIDTSTLAEDTYTTFTTQKLGKKVIYEGNAFVYAEEPTTILDVWKQRFRWARGNLQITKTFRKVWFRGRHSRLGSFFFGLIWFSVVLTPITMILSALGFLGLFFVAEDHTAQLFFYLASISLFLYLYTTIYAIVVDRRTSRLSWLEGIMYPGIISLLILAISMKPDLFFRMLSYVFYIQDSRRLHEGALLFMVTWSATCMFFAWVVFRLERAGVPERITNFLLIIVGYGPLLCTINLAAYIAEIKRPNMKWDKTEKATSKRVLRAHAAPVVAFDFDNALKKDIKREYRFLCRQLMSIAIVCAIFYLIL